MNNTLHTKITDHNKRYLALENEISEDFPFDALYAITLNIVKLLK